MKAEEGDVINGNKYKNFWVKEKNICEGNIL